jgi:hypothetical protein
MGAITHYEDFDLHLTKEGDQYMAEVRNSPAGPSQRVSVKIPFGSDSSEVLLLKLENAVLKGRGLRSGPLTSEERILQEFGIALFRAVFRDADTVANRFASSLDTVARKVVPGQADYGLRLVLHVEPPELSMLPWEYMFDPSASQDGNYLCLQNNSPLVRCLSARAEQSPMQVNGPLRILGMIANPSNNEWPALDAEIERRRIEEAFSKIEPAIHFEWVRGGTSDDLIDIMQRGPWHIFHFIGHGGTEKYVDDDGTTRTEGFVVLQDGLGGAAKIRASDFRLALQNDGSLRLSVLNCCDSGHGSSGFSSVGATLVKSTVPLAVAMQYPISDGSAARFAGKFYSSLVLGQCVERALTTTRVYMRMQSNIEWGIPVLFTRIRSGVLFDIRSSNDEASDTPGLPTTVVVPSPRDKARKELRRLFNIPESQ